ncbi:PepSY-associated TM helix domain-containing protein [Pseudomonas solani]|uniref:PepSY-associated TM helix domain-containing protein n=1 Tax=Pseudomonas solani TaxID=2731552 RepID=UPI003F4AA544
MPKKSRSRLWFLVHSWLAMPIWCFMLIVCVTGTLAVVSQELVWLAKPEVRASKTEAGQQRMGYDQIVSRLHSAQPDAVISAIRRPGEDHFALLVDVSYPDTSVATLYVNPYTGTIQGRSSSFDFRQFTRALHGWWLVPFSNGYSWGWYLVSLLGLPMLASLVTGLVVYKRFWKGFLTPRLRFDQGARIFWGDFHRLSGIWSIWFIAVIAITGLWFLLQAILSDNHITLSSEGIPPVLARDAVPIATPGKPVARIELERAVAIASQTIPSLEAEALYFPEDAYSALYIYGSSNYPLMYQSVALNPFDGEVVAVRRLGDRSPLEFITESMHPLHTGDFGGLWSKLIWFAFGLILSLMVLSGFLIWSKRTAQATLALVKRNQRLAGLQATREQQVLCGE